MTGTEGNSEFVSREGDSTIKGRARAKKSRLKPYLFYLAIAELKYR